MKKTGIIVIDRDLKIVGFNRGIEAISGRRAPDILGKKVSGIFAEWGQILPWVKKSLSSGESFSGILSKILTSNADPIQARISITNMQDSDDDEGGAVLIIQVAGDIISPIQQKTAELLDERNKLQAIFNSRMEGTFTVDNDCNITLFNRSAEKITGYSAEDAIGSKCWEIFDSQYCTNNCLKNGEKRSIDHRSDNVIMEIYITRKDKRRVPIRVSSAPLYNSEEQCVGRVESFQDMTELVNLTSHLKEKFQLPHIIGNSDVMRKVYRLIENVSQSNSTVLITGESGTGKELVARSIHLHSYRRSGPFIALNCSAFVENLLESELFGHEKGAFTGAVQTKRGRFELAQGGTLFLDEIGDMSLPVQVKLLRVLEARQFERVGGNKSFDLNARLIVATNKDLSKELEEGRFREDFYYRINVINIHLPSLRERMEDLPQLIQHLIEKNSTRFSKRIKSLSPSSFTLFKNYNWPGNIRELENVLEHAFVMCQGEIIETEHLPEKLWDSERIETNSSSHILTPIKHAEKLMIRSLLEKYGGHRGKTADALGIDKSTLWRKMKKLDLL